MRGRFIIVACGLLAGCAREAWHAPLVLPSQADTLGVPVGTSIGKFKAHNVILQAGTGNTAGITDNAQAGKKADAAAIGAGSSAAATKPASGPWWLYGIAGLACVALGLWLRGKLPF